MLRAANDALDKGDADAFAACLHGAEEDVAIARAIGDLESALRAYLRRMGELYGEKGARLAASMASAETFQGIGAPIVDPDDVHIFLTEDAALIRSPAQRAYLVVRDGQDWKIDALDWLGPKFRQGTALSAGKNTRPMTDEEIIAMTGMVTEAFRKASAEDLVEGGDPQAAMESLKSRLRDTILVFAFGKMADGPDSSETQEAPYEEDEGEEIRALKVDPEDAEDEEEIAPMDDLWEDEDDTPTVED